MSERGNRVRRVAIPFVRDARSMAIAQVITSGDGIGVRP